MTRLSSALEQEYGLRNTIKRETWYPCVTLVASFLVPPIVDLVVNPNVGLYFREAVLPLLEAGGFLLAAYVLTRLLSQFKTGL